MRLAFSQDVRGHELIERVSVLGDPSFRKNAPFSLKDLILKT